MIGPRRAEATRSGPGVAQHVVAGAADARIGGIGAQLVQEDQLPHGAGVLGGVSGARLDPPSLGGLGVQDRPDGLVRGAAARAVTTSASSWGRSHRRWSVAALTAGASSASSQGRGSPVRWSVQVISHRRLVSN